MSEEQAARDKLWRVIYDAASKGGRTPAIDIGDAIDVYRKAVAMKVVRAVPCAWRFTNGGLDCLEARLTFPCDRCKALKEFES